MRAMFISEPSEKTAHDSSTQMMESALRLYKMKKWVHLFLLFIINKYITSLVVCNCISVCWLFVAAEKIRGSGGSHWICGIASEGEYNRKSHSCFFFTIFNSTFLFYCSDWKFNFFPLVFFFFKFNNGRLVIGFVPFLTTNNHVSLGLSPSEIKGGERSQKLQI